MPAARSKRSKIAHGNLDHCIIVRDRLQRGVVEADARSAIDHGNRRGDGTAVAYLLFDCARHIEIARSRQTVADDGGFQRNNRSLRRKRVGNLGMDLQIRDAHASTVVQTCGILPVCKLRGR